MCSNVIKWTLINYFVKIKHNIVLTWYDEVTLCISWKRLIHVIMVCIWTCHPCITNLLKLHLIKVNLITDLERAELCLWYLYIFYQFPTQLICDIIWVYRGRSQNRKNTVLFLWYDPLIFASLLCYALYLNSEIYLTNAFGNFKELCSNICLLNYIAMES